MSVNFTKRVIDLPNLKNINKAIPGGRVGVKTIEGCRLAKLAHDRETIVEIGAAMGRSAAFMASGLRYARTKGTIYSVDIWDDEKWLADYKANLKKLGLLDYVVPIRKSSAEAAAEWDKSIDLLFIDANHSYAHVKQDFELWFPLVVKGGLIAFHDYGSEAWEGVTRFVDSIPNNKLRCIGVHRTLWAGEVQ